VDREENPVYMALAETMEDGRLNGIKVSEVCKKA
jgi:hypothetical protein